MSLSEENMIPLLSAEERAIPTFCAMCGPSAGCGIYAIVKNGRFVRVEGMKQAPLNKGRLCAKAHAAPQWVYSNERLKYPLRRVGARGEGRFERISWDEALDTIAAKLQEQKEKYGPESLAILSPARRTYSAYLYRFLAAHGSPNYGHSGICVMQRQFAFTYTVGGVPLPDISKSDVILIWGKQPAYAGSSKGAAQQLIRAKERGAKIIAIKPTMEPDVALADLWVPLRPGTDAALALAMLHVIIGEKLYDEKFVAEWTYGFEQLAEHLRKYSPEWAQTITGVEASQIRTVARLYATTPAACIDHGNGLEHAPSCSDAVRAIASLIAITGKLDQPGCNLLNFGFGRALSGSGPKFTLLNRYTQDLVDKTVAPEFPRAFQPFGEGTASAYYGIFNSVLTGKPYPVRTIIAPGTQPTVSMRGTKRILEALEKVDFFVVVDVARTAEMAWADIVVPVATMYETDHPFEAIGNWAMARNRVIAPLGDYKSDYEFWIELGTRLGYGADFWNGSIDRCMEELLQPYKITMEELRQHPCGITLEPPPTQYGRYQQFFNAPSARMSHEPHLPQGKVALYNTTFEAHGFSPMPEWVEPPESLTATPELRSKYPLLFSDFHTSKVYNAGWLRHVPYLREIMPDPVLQIHPQAAQARGIQPGDWIVVESPHGKLRLRAEVNPGIRPDTVMVLHGWWQGCDELHLPGYELLDGANSNSMYNVCHPRTFDPLVTAMSSQTLVEVKKA